MMAWDTPALRASCLETIEARDVGPSLDRLTPVGHHWYISEVMNQIATMSALSSTDTALEGKTPKAVEISHLRKTYGPLVAVDDVSFSVAEGEIFGILGPNGAGKTTTVECAIGLRSPDSGTIRLMGMDPQADKARIHEITGVQLQSGAFPAKLRVGEIIDMYRSFYPHPADVSELAGALGLADKRKSYYRSLSGGQQQRLSVVLALIGDAQDRSP